MTKVTFFNVHENIREFFEQFVAIDKMTSPLQIGSEYYPTMVELFLKEQGSHYMDVIPDEAQFSAIKSFFNLESVGDGFSDLYKSIIEYNQEEVEGIFEEVLAEYNTVGAGHYEGCGQAPLI